MKGRKGRGRGHQRREDKDFRSHWEYEIEVEGKERNRTLIHPEKEKEKNVKSRCERKIQIDGVKARNGLEMDCNGKEEDQVLGKRSSPKAKGNQSLLCRCLVFSQSVLGLMLRINRSDWIQIRSCCQYCVALKPINSVGR